jgi:CO/xanthine dehydrogenase FAD-binding subunit
MKPFEYVTPQSVGQASQALGGNSGSTAGGGPQADQARILAGGTDLLGLMKDYIVSPTRLVNIKNFPTSTRSRRTETAA